MTNPSSLLVRVLLLFGLFLYPGSSLGQGALSYSEPSDVQALFANYTDAFFQEKLYIHTDKDSYMTGETIWFKVYRVDGMKHSLHYYSGVLYVELRDPESNLVRRMQLVKKDGCFQGSYVLEEGLASGYYEIVAYTNWMQNFDTDFYFKKRIYIYNAPDQKVKADIQYTDIPENNTIAVEFSVTDETGVPYDDVFIDVRTHGSGKKLDMISRITDKAGKIKFNLRKDAGVSSIEVWFKGQVPVNYKRYFKVPLFDYEMDMHFMPEGGHLLAGLTQKVAFKAIGPDGKGVEVRGDVFDDRDNEVGSFSTSYLGMGVFSMQSEEGRTYYAKVRNKEGREMRVNLPEVALQGIAVTADTRDGRIIFRAVPTHSYDISDLNMILHSRGKVIAWTSLIRSSFLRIPAAYIPEGVAHCFIVSGAGKVLSERLVFVNRDEKTHDIGVSGLKPDYGHREQVELEIDMLQEGLAPLEGELSISVVDAMNSPRSNDVRNIVSYLLLDSDIKGHVENATYYFDRNVPAEERALNADLLMMTQGWKRFDTGTIYSKEMPKLDFSVELGQSISGRITRRFGRETSSGRLTLMATKESKLLFADTMEADSAGYFSFNVSYPNSTIFIIRGAQKGNRRNVDITIDPMVFKDYPYDKRNNYVYGKAPEAVTKDAPDEGMSPEQFYARQTPGFYYENGEKVYALAGAEVFASRPTSNWRRLQLQQEIAYRTTPEKMIDEGYYTVKDWILSIPGITIDYNWRGSGYTAILYNNRQIGVSVPNSGFLIELSDMGVDITQRVIEMPLSAFKTINIGTPGWINRDDPTLMSEDELKTMDVDPILRVEPLHESGTMRPDKMWIYEFSQLGYLVPDKFYSPRYEGGIADNGERDERVTVFWDPCVKLDKNGKARISFYTTDVDTKYRMIVEGMVVRDGSSGIPVHMETEFFNGDYGVDQKR